MKRFFLLLAVLFLFGCRKEENKSGYYNRDGSPVTWEQARDITEHLWSMFDYAFISMDILPSSTRIIQRYADQVSDPYYSPAYDSWVVVMSPDPRYINGFRFYRYVFVNAKTGEIFIDSIEREVDKESIRWREIKSLPQNDARQPKYPAKTKSTTAFIRFRFLPGHTALRGVVTQIGNLCTKDGFMWILRLGDVHHL